MKNLKKNILAILMVLGVCCSITSSVSAKEDSGDRLIGLSYKLPNVGGVSNYSVNHPSKDDLYTKNEYHDVSGKASEDTLYTNKCFYGVEIIGTEITTYQTKKTTQTLRRYTLIGSVSVEKTTFEKSSAATSSTIKKNYNDLNKGYYYFLSYSAPCNFKGKIIGWDH